jgi:hypothetical protein
MKRILAILVLTAALAVPASAQSPHMLGIKGGLNYFNLYGDDAEQASYRVGFAIGAQYSYMFNEIFSLQPELYYSIKGSKNEKESDVKLELGYLEIPVLFKATLPIESEAWSPGIYAGPYVAFLMNASVDDVDVKDEFKGTDYGLVVGAAVDFPLSGGMRTLTLDFRYSIGFAKLDEQGEAEIYNNGFQILAGFGFSM